jgi:hypothetical protein
VPEYPAGQTACKTLRDQPATQRGHAVLGSEDGDLERALEASFLQRTMALQAKRRSPWCVSP